MTSNYQRQSARRGVFHLRNIKLLHLRSAKVNRETWIKMSPAQYFLISVSAKWSTIKRVNEDKFLNTCISDNNFEQNLTTNRKKRPLIYVHKSLVFFFCFCLFFLAGGGEAVNRNSACSHENRFIFLIRKTDKDKMVIKLRS